MTSNSRFAFAEYREILRTNSAVYKALVRRAQQAHRAGNTELTLQRIETAAKFAGRYHPGRLSDGTIENIALEIGRQLQHDSNVASARAQPSAETVKRRRVLHVATRVFAVGGHTRMIRHWVENDRSSCHSLVLLNSVDESMPEWLSRSLSESGGTVHTLPRHLTLVERALQLRSLAQRQCELVVLHHHPHDVVPTVAFATANGPPVALLNHADHLFWLGSSVSDLVVDLRSTATAISTTRRGARGSAMLPIPLSLPSERVSRQQARTALGIPDNQVVLLSIGHDEKYRPCGPLSFVAAANLILMQCPNAHLYVVGASYEQLHPHLTHALHQAIHFVGVVENPNRYFAAADIYLESFPFGSNTALLEAARSALPVVSAPAPIFPLLVGGNDSLDDILTNPEDVNEFVRRVALLVASPSMRTEQGGALAQRVLTHHTGQGWLRHLNELYDLAARTKHEPAAIPTTSYADSNGDIALTLRAFFSEHPMMVPESSDSARSASPGAMDATSSNFASRKPMALTKLIARYRVHIAREAREFALARRFAILAVSSEPFSRVAWRRLAAAALGQNAAYCLALLRRARSAHSEGTSSSGDQSAGVQSPEAGQSR